VAPGSHSPTGETNAVEKTAVTEVKTKKVTFDTALPRGTCATFTHEGQRWIAYPQDKAIAVATVVDRMLGCVDRVRDDLVRWMNAHPEDAAQLVPLLARTSRAKEFAREKVQAWTM
jgi:hypothetical protein